MPVTCRYHPDPRRHAPGGDKKAVISLVVDDFAVDDSVRIQPAADLKRAERVKLVVVGDTALGEHRVDRQQRHQRKFSCRDVARESPAQMVRMAPCPTGALLIAPPQEWNL